MERPLKELRRLGDCVVWPRGENGLTEVGGFVQGDGRAAWMWL